MTKAKTGDFGVVRVPLSVGQMTGATSIMANGLVALASLIILLPMAVFAVSLHVLPRSFILLGLALALYVFLARRPLGPTLAAPLVWHDLALCLAAALVLCVLGGQGHFFYSAWDWMSRDAVLADLVGQGGLPFYRLNGQDYVLRAPAGMYLMPALLGRWVGLAGAHYAMLIQNALLLAAILYLASRLMRGAKAAAVAGLMFFSPLDIVPRIALDLWTASETGTFVLSPLTMFWNPMVPVWGLVPSLFWAPNHTLPGWLTGLLFLYYLRGEVPLAHLGLLFVVSLLWSPLAMIGMIPFLAYALVKDLRARRPGQLDLIAIAAAACFVPVALYLHMDAGALAREWMIGMPRFWVCYGLMLLFAIPHAWLLLSSWDDVPGWRRAAIAIAVVALVVMPVYRFGAAYGDNDMALRCTIVPMFLLGFAFADHVDTFSTRGNWRAALAVVCVTLGGITGVMEIRRAVMDPAWRINDCNLLTALHKASPGFLPVNYLARVDRMPEGLVIDRGQRFAPEQRLCWPGYPLAQE